MIQAQKALMAPRRIWYPTLLSQIAGWFGRHASLASPKRLSIASSLIALFLYLFFQLTRDIVYIDSFAVPPQWDEGGFTSQVISHRVACTLKDIETTTNTRMRKDQVALPADAETSIPDDIQVLGTKLSLRSLVHIAQELTGREPRHIHGEITMQWTGGRGAHAPKESFQTHEIDFTIRIRPQQSGTTSHIIHVPTDDPNKVVPRIAEEILHAINPYVLAVYLRSEKHDAESAITIV